MRKFLQVGEPLTLGVAFSVLALTIALSPRSSPGITRSTLTSQASYVPVGRIASVKSSSFGPLLLSAQSPCPSPSRPVMRRSRSFVARSTRPIFSRSLRTTVSALGTARLVRAGTLERAARMASDLRTLVKEVPLRRRPAAGFDAAAWRSELRTELSPAVSIWKAGGASIALRAAALRAGAMAG